MNIPDQSTNFFCILLPTYGEFSSHAEVDYDVFPPKVHRCCCAIDVFPKSRIFEIFPCIFAEESLSAALIESKCTGFTLHEADCEPSDTFREFHKEPKQIPRFKWFECHGNPGVDDFGLERGTRLIISKRAKDIIESGPHEEITFILGAKAPSDEEIERILQEESKRVAQRIYEGRKNSKRECKGVSPHY